MNEPLPSLPDGPGLRVFTRQTATVIEAGTVRVSYVPQCFDEPVKVRSERHSVILETLTVMLAAKGLRVDESADRALGYSYATTKHDREWSHVLLLEFGPLHCPTDQAQWEGRVFTGATNRNDITELLPAMFGIALRQFPSTGNHQQKA